MLEQLHYIMSWSCGALNIKRFDELIFLTLILLTSITTNKYPPQKKKQKKTIKL